MKTLLTLIFTFSIIIVAFTHATPTLIIRTQPQMNQSSMLIHTQQQNETKRSGNCDYKVTITTSCKSPLSTKDEISILFGDADGSEVVYVPRLDDPDSGTTFEQCTTMDFEILGPCIGKICKMYLFRNGTDGWIPETVTASHHDNPPVTFKYNIDIPKDSGYGFNNCG
uniref:Nodule-specific PLAT domain protein n=1 Tax=Medicago truncatula TaxID=3880 RepID=A0A1Q1N9P9_MEDTR|nr:nodule-specific PLAT domain protein [Medicago truncatula]